MNDVLRSNVLQGGEDFAQNCLLLFLYRIIQPAIIDYKRDLGGGMLNEGVQTHVIKIGNHVDTSLTAASIDSTNGKNSAMRERLQHYVLTIRNKLPHL